MTTNLKYVQAQDFFLAGSGSIIGATSITLKSFKAIDGVTPLTMTDFGTVGFATIEPGNGTQEEQISFTGVTQNSNGTATLTGVKSVLFVNPYTATAGTTKTHAGSTTLIITNTSGFYDQFPAKDNDETITGQWTFNVFPITPATPLATEADAGFTKLSVAADNVLDPISVGTNDGRVPVAYAVDSVGTDSYAITPSPAITAYVAGQKFTFQAGTANTGACTLNVNALGAKSIVKNTNVALETGDILLNEIVQVIYDGTNMQLVTPRVIDGATQITGEIPLSNLPIPTFQQDLVLSTVQSTAGGGFAFGSNTDGSVIYCIPSDVTEDLFRFERDAITGQYMETHRVNMTLVIPANDSVGIIQIGNYIYVFTNDATNIICSRFLAADLTGEQVMTVPVVTTTNDVTAWTDGTFAYVIGSGSNTTSRKWSVSGTTFTAESTAVVSSDLNRAQMSSMWDGTTAYIVSGNGYPTTTIYKLTAIDGSTTSATTKTMSGLISDQKLGGICIPVPNGRMYIGLLYGNWNELNADTVIGTNIRLYPISKP